MPALLRQWRLQNRFSPAELLAFEEIQLLKINAAAEPPAAPWMFFTDCHPAVVLGTGQKWREEINRMACSENGMPVLRRPSGGGCVLHLPGMLWFSLGVPFTWLPQGLAGGIRATFQDCLTPLCAVLRRRVGLPVELQGICDIAVNDGGDAAAHWRKLAGSAQCRKQHAVLTHGTLLIDAHLEQIPVFLAEPQKRPEYRAQRNHLDFVVNLQSLAPAGTKVDAQTLAAELAQAWVEMLTPQAGAIQVKQTEVSQEDLAAARELVRSKYDTPEWTYRL